MLASGVVLLILVLLVLPSGGLALSPRPGLPAPKIEDGLLPKPSPSVTVQICEVRQGSVLTSTCAATGQAGDFVALYVSVGGFESPLSLNSNLTVTGSGGIPLAWTSAWMEQTPSQCGAAVCKNGFFNAETNSSGGYSGYSYCEPGVDAYCDGTGQGAAFAPPAGGYTVSVCTGTTCLSGTITIGSTTTSTSTTSTTTTSTSSGQSVALRVTSIGASTGVAGSYVLLNATVSIPGATGVVRFNGTGPGGAQFPGSYCALSNGWCTVSVQLETGTWTVAATFDGASSGPITVDIPAVTSAPSCIGNTTLSDFMYVANYLDNSISQYAVNPSGNGGVLCSVGPPYVLPPGSFPDSLTFTPTGESIWGSGGWAAGSTLDSGTLSIFTASNCVEGLDVAGLTGDLLEGGTVTGNTPGACMAPQQSLDQPVGMAMLSYGGEGEEYVLNQGNSTITQLVGGGTPARITYIQTLQNPTSIVADAFNSNQTSPPLYCVFVDNQTSVIGYEASEYSNTHGTFYTLTPTAPVTGSFSSMLVNPSSDVQGGPVRVLYALSPSQDKVYEMQVDYNCKLSVWKTEPTGQVPIGMVDIGTSYLFVLNAGSTGQASISSYSMNNTLSESMVGDGSLTPNGGPTPAGFDAAAIGTDYNSFNGKNFGDQYFFVADAGSQTIDEYAVPGSGLPQYIGAIPSEPGALAFASGFNGCFLDCVNGYVEFETLTFPNATESAPYSYTIPLGPSDLNPYADMRLYSGSLPPGLTLDQFTGTISGTPSSLPSDTGTYTFSVEEEGSATLIGEFSITLLPAGSSSSTSSTQGSNSQSTITSSSNCGRSCSPPGLTKGWATSNSSVNALAEPHPAILDQQAGIDVYWVQLESSPGDQLIGNVAYNQSVLQVEFNRPGLVELSLQSTEAPAAVYADDIALRAAMPQNLSFTEPGYYYNQTSHIMTVFADPGSVTLFYGRAPAPVASRSTSSASSSTISVSAYSTGLLLLLVAVIAVVIVGVAIAAGRLRPGAPRRDADESARAHRQWY